MEISRYYVEDGAATVSLEDFVRLAQEANVKIRSFRIIDHGNNTYGQEYGNAYLTPKDFSVLRPVLTNNARIVLYGCLSGNTPSYVESIAQHSWAVVVALTRLVNYGHKVLGQRQFKPANWTPESKERIVADGR